MVNKRKQLNFSSVIILVAGAYWKDVRLYRKVGFGRLCDLVYKSTRFENWPYALILSLWHHYETKSHAGR